MFFPKSNIIALVIHISPRPNTFPTSTSNLALEVSSSRSKVTQFRESIFLISLLSISFYALCPVYALREFFDTCLAPAASLVFVLSTATVLRSISYSTNHLTGLLRLPGLNPGNYSGHSFRHGGATYASSLNTASRRLGLNCLP